MFNLGQFRRDQLNYDNYLSPLDYTIKDFQVQSQSLEMKFFDKAIQVSSKMRYGQNYYIRLAINKDSSSHQRITMQLRNSSVTNSDIQTLQTYYIPKENSINEKTTIIQFVISPNATYDQIILHLERKKQDFNKHQDDDFYGRVLNVRVESFGKITNLLGQVITPTVLTKIGVQGPPGLLMCINGQGIRIGPSGIYQINNGYQVNFLGFIVLMSDDTPDKRDFFILDYQYKQEE